MLKVTAYKLRDPMAFGVLMKAGDRSSHERDFIGEIQCDRSGACGKLDSAKFLQRRELYGIQRVEHVSKWSH